MIINITILEDNKSDFITLSDSIKKWAANTGILINIIWLNSYKKFIKSLPTAVYGIQRSPFCFRTAVFRSQRPPIC